MTLNYQIHGYKNGHQLLSSNINLNRVDQDTVDRLSDISGPLSPGQTFDPYFTCYPLPSNNYFTIARTWQDFTVQRAGCVITKSIIVSISDWETVPDIYCIFQILLNTNLNKEETIDLSNYSEKGTIPPVIEPVVDELVEALFLDIRQPIVIFNSINPDLITIRLYSVFWVTLKKSFSICTFSLAQRNIGGKPFDLLFAPSNVKAKFSEWSGRRIDAGSKTRRGPRHRWTSELSNQIFNSPFPKLIESNSNNFINYNSNFNETTLRLSLLWNDLLTKVVNENSPLAILGLLDIMNSQPVFVYEAYKKLKPYIYNSLENAKNRLPIENAWKFFAALLGKHQRKLMDRPLIAKVREACAQVADRDPRASINFIETYNNLTQPISSVLFAGIGDGLALHFINGKDFSLFNAIKPSTSLRLLASSKQFSKLLTEFKSNQLTIQFAFIKHALEFDSSKLKAKAVKNLSAHITNEDQMPLVDLLLRISNYQSFKDIARNIGMNTGFEINTFNNILLQNAAKLGQLDYLKDLVLNSARPDYICEMLSKIIVIEPRMIKWLMEEIKLTQSQKNTILISVFKVPNAYTIDVVSNDSKLSTVILNSLLQINEGDYNDSIATLLTVANIPIDDALVELHKLPARAIQSIKADVARNFIFHAFIKSSIKNEILLVEILNKTTQIDLISLIRHLTSSSIERNQIISNIRKLMLGGTKIYSGLLIEVENISRLIATNMLDAWDLDIITGWIRLSKSIRNNKEIQRNVAAIMLDFGYKSKKYDPTELIVTSFPVVYKTFLKGKSITQFISNVFFPDWDRCRILREDLVSRYQNSKWSRFGLFRVATEADILKDVILILFEMEDGKKFIRQAVSESKEIGIKESHPVIKALKDLKFQI